MLDEWDVHARNFSHVCPRPGLDMPCPHIGKCESTNIPWGASNVRAWLASFCDYLRAYQSDKLKRQFTWYLSIHWGPTMELSCSCQKGVVAQERTSHPSNLTTFLPINLSSIHLIHLQWFWSNSFGVFQANCNVKSTKKKSIKIIYQRWMNER